MKNIQLITIMLLMPLSVISQKVAVQVINEKKSPLNVWQVMDAGNTIVFSGKDYFRDDTVSFGLEANMKYFFRVSVSESYAPGTVLYSFQLEGEPILIINSDIGPGEHLFPFFTGTRAVNVKITGGMNASIADFPWQVYYIAGDYRCGGSIIDENWVVTAAHCTEKEDGSAILASDMAVKVGTNNPYSALDGKKYFVLEVIVHEGYNSSTLENDIALLRMRNPINYTGASPINLISSSDVVDGATIPGVMSWVTGWGLTSVNPKVFPTSLQKVQLPIVSNTTASAVWGTIPGTDLMAGYRNGNKDACSGDSGGPLVVPVLGEYKLAGIVSWGSTTCNSYGGYTRVSLFDSWISTKTGIPLSTKPASPVGETIVCEDELSGAYSIEKVPDATAYEWRLYPASAGDISGNSESSSVLWNTGYTGTLNVLVRVTVNNVVSDWSNLIVKIVKNTKILSQSADTVICSAQPLELKENAEGNNLIYRWYHNGTIVQTGVSNMYNIISTNPSNSGDYRCEISGSCGSVVSDIVKLTVYPLTDITSVTPDVEAAYGHDVTLEVNADGHDLMYHWQKDGVLLNNSNSARLFLQDVNTTDIGLYQNIVSGTCGTQVSDSVYVYVKKFINPDATEVFIWPTITNSVLNAAIKDESSYNIQIYSITGKLMIEKINCHYQTLIDVSKLPKGVYIIRVLTKSLQKASKFFIV
jgi:hypothetical protein